MSTVAIRDSELRGISQQYWRPLYRVLCFLLAKSGPILDLPTELLLDIVSRLTLLEKACLAVSCKGFYQLFGSVLKAKKFYYDSLQGLHMKTGDPIS